MAFQRRHLCSQSSKIPVVQSPHKGRSTRTHLSVWMKEKGFPDFTLFCPPCLLTEMWNRRAGQGPILGIEWLLLTNTQQKVRVLGSQPTSVTTRADTQRIFQRTREKDGIKWIKIQRTDSKGLQEGEKNGRMGEKWGVGGGFAANDLGSFTSL